MAQYPTPVYPNWGESLGGAVNQGFDGIIQGMQQAQKEKMANLAFQGQTGYDPKALLQGQAVGQQLAGMGNPQNAPTTGAPPLPQGQMDLYQQFQNFTNQGRQKTQAGVADIQSQANQRNATAALNNQYTQNIGGQAAPMLGAAQQMPATWSPPVAAPMAQEQPPLVPQGPMRDAVAQPTGPDVKTEPKTGRQYVMEQTKTGPHAKFLSINSASLAPEDQAAYEWGMTKGNLRQGLMRSRGVGTQAMIQGIKDSPEYKADLAKYGGTIPMAAGFNPVQGEIDFAGKKSEAQATGAAIGGPGFKTGAIVRSMDDTIRNWEPLVNKLSPSQWQMVNSAFTRGEASIANDRDANAALGYANTLRGLYSQTITGGAGTVESDAKANQTIAPGLNAEGFEGMKSAVLAEGYSRATRMTERNPAAPQAPAGYIQESGAAAPGAAKGGPETIDIIDSTGGSHTILKKNLAVARQRDPKLRVKGGR